ncbi:hypothetical protein FHG87_006635 [Trinorchestia longiramus]|nr:hypothetical protein FHG87_006635 [Trinorchestia longiramus]
MAIELQTHIRAVSPTVHLGYQDTVYTTHAPLKSSSSRDSEASRHTVISRYSIRRERHELLPLLHQPRQERQEPGALQHQQVPPSHTVTLRRGFESDQSLHDRQPWTIRHNSSFFSCNRRAGSDKSASSTSSTDAGSEKSASSTTSKDSKYSIRDKGSRRSSANDSDYGRYDSANSGSNFSDDTTDRRVRSPLRCQCSCHDREGRQRSGSRDRRGSGDSLNGRNSSSNRRNDSSNSDRHNRRNDSSNSDRHNNRRNDSSHSDRRNDSSNSDRHNDNNRHSNRRDSNDDNRHNDSEDDGDGRMPPININDRRATKSNKGSFFSRNSPSRYRTRSDSKTSQFRVTSVDSNKKRRDRPPFKYYGGRSLSTGDLRSIGGIKNDYDYAHEGFLTPRFTSEYKARYEMKHGQRYNVGSDKIIRYIDPAGEHILIPKDSPQLQRTVSDSDIPTSIHSRNNRNVKLEPIDRKTTANGNKGAAPARENRQWLPTKKQSAQNLPPMDKTPAMPDTSRRPTSMSHDTTHPLGLNTPPKRHSQLYPM